MNIGERDVEIEVLSIFLNRQKQFIGRNFEYYIYTRDMKKQIC